MDNKLYQPIIKGVIGLIILWVIQVIFEKLPMIQEMYISELGFSGTAIVEIVITTLMILVLWNMGRELLPELEIRFSSWPEVYTIAASVIQIIIIVLAYNALEPIAYKIFDQDILVYQLIFLLLIVYPLIRGGLALYNSVDTMTELYGSKLEVPSQKSQLDKCPNCGSINSLESKFCANCGEDLSKQSENNTS